MTNRPKTALALMLLWLVLAFLFILWGFYSLTIMLDVTTWVTDVPVTYQPEFNKITPILHFGYLLSTVLWLVFAAVFVVFSYGTLKKDHKIWTAGLIVSTIFLAIFSLMLISFIVNSLMFKDDFSIAGLVTTIIAFITDLGVIFFITRPMTKLYFELE